MNQMLKTTVTVFGIGLAVLMWALVARSRRLGRELVQFNRGVLASVPGCLDGLKVAKVHGLEPGHLTSFDSAIARSRRSHPAVRLRRPAGRP